MRVRIVGALAQPLKQILECAPDYDLAGRAAEVVLVYTKYLP